MARNNWHKRTMMMPPDHAWTSRPGCKILVLDRGAVRIDYPQEWSVRPASDCMEVHDKPPPDDNCRLAISYLRLEPIDWSGLRLASLIEQGELADTRHIISRADIVEDR